MTDNILRHDTRCRVCASTRIEPAIRLIDTPLEDQFVKSDSLTYEQPVYPLQVALCTDCGYLHLTHIINPALSYADYTYVTQVTVGLPNHYDDYASEIVNCYGIQANTLAVDIGSNDGSMLASFQRAGLTAIGVEPARGIAERANANGFPTITGFLTGEVAAELIATHGKASVISANYMYANVDDLHLFTKQVAKILQPAGVFVIQTGYHPEQMKINMFDYIYHEHFSYFTVETLHKLFATCGLQLIDVQKTEPKGGSLRAVAQLSSGVRAVSATVANLLAEESSAEIRSLRKYRIFEEGLQTVKHQLLAKLQILKSSGERIVGFGASHSTTTLIYHFELAPFLEYIVDDNKSKHGLYSPGHHIPVYPVEKLVSEGPCNVIVLAWQHQQSILAKHRQHLPAIHWITPLPLLSVS